MYQFFIARVRYLCITLVALWSMPQNDLLGYLLSTLRKTSQGTLP